jgi:hypothetical protein
MKSKREKYPKTDKVILLAEKARDSLRSYGFFEANNLAPIGRF